MNLPIPVGRVIALVLGHALVLLRVDEISDLLLREYARLEIVLLLRHSLTAVLHCILTL
jgi:hypothetical protein